MSSLTSLSKTRANYYRYVEEYRNRREAMRKKYNVPANLPFKGNEKYTKAVANINKKIKLWNRYIAAIDKKTNAIVALCNAVATFTGINVKGRYIKSHSQRDERVKLAKSLFYKYGMENKMAARDLREFIGAKRVYQPSEYRREFTKGFSNPDNKQVWLNFKAHIQSMVAEADTFIDNRKTPGA